MENIIIAGKRFKLEKPASNIMSNLWLGLLTEFDVSQFVIGGYNMLLLVARDSVWYSPVQRSKIAHRIECNTGCSAVFYFDNLPTYERDRLVDRGVYFVVGDKFAHVPTLHANRRLSNVSMPTTLLPPTQYLLMLHLQQCSLNGMTIKEIEKVTPFRYSTVARSVQQLAALGLADCETGSGRTKRLSIKDDKRGLWNDSLAYLTNPIKHVGYACRTIDGGLIGGIEALSHYTMLTGEEIPTKVFSLAESDKSGITLVISEDVQRVEIWKYPPVADDGYVDRLSLYLTLRDDPDPRVQKELETMINEMPW